MAEGWKGEWVSYAEAMQWPPVRFVWQLTEKGLDRVGKWSRCQGQLQVHQWQWGCHGEKCQSFVAVTFNLDVVAKSPERMLVAEQWESIFQTKPQKCKAEEQSLRIGTCQNYRALFREWQGYQAEGGWEKRLAMSTLTRDQCLEHARTLQMNQKLDAPSPQWTEDKKRQFMEGETLLDNRYMKRCSSSPVITTLQNKITMRFHLHPPDWQKLGSWIMPNGGRDVWILEFLKICRLVQAFWRAVLG